MHKCPIDPAEADRVALANARDLAAALRLKVKSGTDPLAEREKAEIAARAEAQATMIAGITFRKVAEAYIAANEESWRNSKHRQQWRNTLETYVYPVIGDVAAGDIGTEHVLQIIEPIWKDKPETASRIRGRIETILDAAKVRGYRSGENPARWRGHIAQILPARTKLSRGHHKALPYEDVPKFMEALRKREAVAALALEFTILTATRTSEALGAQKSEFDIDKAIWTIPAARMKAGKEHRVPLSPRALEIVTAMQIASSDWLFPGTKGIRLSSMAMSMLLKRMDVDATVHGFRSSFRDWSAERTSYAHEVCEMALAHTIGNKSEAAYRRGDLFEKRRRLMSDWAAFCASGAESGANVTPIRQADAG